ncbi:hypothetical protein HRbin36_00426 [bacterium HR36]|nr:hypothetical protein HRbin36_00426 [bacterium HR36]
MGGAGTFTGGISYANADSLTPLRVYATIYAKLQVNTRLDGLTLVRGYAVTGTYLPGGAISRQFLPTSVIMR